jgi:hypothetical protein
MLGPGRLGLREETSLIHVRHWVWQAGILTKQIKPVPGQRSHVGDDWGVWLCITPDGVSETVKVLRFPTCDPLTLDNRQICKIGFCL